MSKFHKDMKGGLNKAETQAKTFGQKFQAALNPKNLFGGIAAGIAGSQIISFLGDAVDAASNMNETISKTGAILGQEALPGLEKWADGAAEAFGQSKQLALDGVSTFAAYGKAADLAGDDLVTFSTDLVELAADLASFNNTSPEQAIQAIGAALRGESEPIRAYQVLLDDATVRQRALKLGIISTTKDALTPQQRVLAVQAEIFAQTSDAQGDYGRTSGGLAGQQKELAAKLQNVNVEIGEKMLPVMVDLVEFLNKDGIPAMREFMELLNFEDENSADGIPILQEIEDFLNTVADAGQGGGIVGDLWNFDPRVAEMAKQFGIDYETMMERIERAADATGEAVEDAKERILGSFDAVGDGAMTIIPQGLKHATSDIGDAAYDAASGIVEPFTEATAEAEAVVARTPGDIAADLRAGKISVDAAAKELAGLIPAPMIQAALDAVEVVRALPGDIAQSIIEGRDAVVVAATALSTAATDPLVNEQRIAETREKIKELATMTAEEIEAATPASEAARKAELEQLEIMLIGYIGRTEGMADEAMGMLAKYAVSNDPATQEAYEAMVSALEERAFVTQHDIEEKAAATGQALPDALARDRARVAHEAYLHFLATREPAQEMVDNINDLAPEAARATWLALRAEKVTAGLEAESYANLIRDPLSKIADEAYPWGKNVGLELARGMDAAIDRVRRASRDMASATGGAIRIESEPPDHGSDLYGITKWGGNIVKTIVDGIYGNLGMAGGAAGALAASLVPGMGAVPMGGMAAAGGGGPTYILNVDGKPYEVDGPRGMVDQLQKIGEQWG